VAYEVQVLGAGNADSGIVVARHSADGTGPEVVFVKGRDAIGTYTTALSDNDAMGRLVWNGADGGDIVPQAASLRVQVDGSTGVNDMPGEMIFATTADGSQSPTDRMSLTAAGAMDLQSATTILNVGAAGNDWTQNALTLAGGSAEQVITAQTTGSAVDAKLDLLLPASSTGNARVRFKQGDGSGDANNMMYQLYYEASSDYLVLRSADSDGGSTAADIWRVPDGQTSIDANTTWDINIFDNYDDAMILSPYRRGVMNLAQRTRELVEMGVLREYQDGWIGYNDQRMAALLAGGIYQTRQRLDSFHTDHERRIGELEIENRRLKELIHA